ncbi:glycoside hydrolase family 32 protein [Corynebacterium otitidis]
MDEPQPTTRFRPELHMIPERGVLNAPATVVVDGATWHLFHQYQPELGAPSRWGHQASEQNPFDWEELDDVLAPEDGEDSLRAGAGVVDGSGVNLYFTSVRGGSREVHLARIDDLAETTLDLQSEELALDPGVRREGPVVTDAAGEAESLRNFRSPCVVPAWRDEDERAAGHDGWLMLAVADNTSGPRLVILESPDGRDFTLTGVLSFAGKDSGLENEHAVVSPRLVRLRDEVDGGIRDILLVNLERDGVDVSGYLVGTLSGAEFTVEQPFRRIDHGHDFTRPRNTHIAGREFNGGSVYDTAIIVGLMGGVGRLDDPSKHPSLKAEGWANAISMPRLLSLQGGLVYQTPVPGILSAVSDSNRARSWTGLAEIPADGESSLTLDILDGEGEVAARVTHRGDRLELDRSMNPYHEGSEPAAASLEEADSDSLTVIVDGKTVEIFADSGQVTMASRVYIEGGCSALRPATTGNAEVANEITRAGSEA